MRKQEIVDIPCEITYRYSGKYNTVEISQNKRLLPKHEAAAKRAFSEMMIWSLKRIIPFPGKVELRYTLIFSDNRRRDRSNVLSKIEKYMNDALIMAGVLSDDSDDVIVRTIYESRRVSHTKKKTVKLEIMEIENV